MSASTALSKQKVVLALLEQLPDLKPFHKFRDCLYHIPHYASRFFSATRKVETLMTRCPLGSRCPKCMDPINVKAARKADHVQLLKMAASLGGGKCGHRCRVWLLEWKGPKKSSKLMANALGRSGDRRVAAVEGVWGGEICGTFNPIIDCNSAKGAATFVFNGLVVGNFDTILYDDILRKKFPGITITCYHGRLADAWEEYLRRWATRQIAAASPAEIVAWMTSRGRMFDAIGSLRGVKRDSKAEADIHREATVGKSTMLGYFNRLEDADRVIARIEREVSLKVSNLLNHMITYDEREEIMANVKTQVRHVLTPSMRPEEVFDRPMSRDELNRRLDQIVEEQRKIIKLLEGDGDDRVTPLSKKIH